jgi:adenylate kinase family enzyme
MNISLPSRYEDIDEAYRGRLEPNKELIATVQKAIKAMQISGGIRFLPVFGKSGSGKSCGSRELSRHLPETHVFLLAREEIENQDKLLKRLSNEKITPAQCYIALIDQFEEQVVGRENIPTEFVEKISILDRTELKNEKILFLWLTTDIPFQQKLERACSRNTRLLIDKNFTIHGPDKSDWLRIVEETFSFHNSEKPLSDFNIVSTDIEKIILKCETIGRCLESTAELLAENIPDIQNLSEYQIILVWPVADDTRMQRVLQFTRPREGYLLNWDAWKRELNSQDQATLPLHEYNRARLYFDMRLVPIRVADIHKLCNDLDNPSPTFGQTYLDWFKKTHLYHIISGNWDNYDYNPVRTRTSARGDDAKQWYDTVTTQPTKIGKRLSLVLKELGEKAEYEQEITSKYSTIKADIFVEPNQGNTKEKIIELKVYSSKSTVPSSIKDQIKVTLRRHAQFAGFLQRQ